MAQKEMELGEKKKRQRQVLGLGYKEEGSELLELDGGAGWPPPSLFDIPWRQGKKPNSDPPSSSQW